MISKLFSLDAVLDKWIGCVNMLTGNLVNWEESDWDTDGNKTVLRRTHICHVPSPGIRQMNFNLNYPESKTFCKSLSSTFVTFEAQEDINLAIGILAHSKNDKDTFWTGFQFDATEKVYVLDNRSKFRKDDMWAKGEPNGEGIQSCVAMTIKGKTATFSDEYCNNKYSFFCYFDSEKIVHVQSDLKIYNVDMYYAFNIPSSFNGYRYGKIIKENEIWIIKTNEGEIVAKTGKLNGLPIGNQSWEFPGKPPEQHFLILHTCNTSSFPCKNGICLDKSKRCDSTFDCYDKESAEDYSDEENCKAVTAAVGYNKLNIPQGKDGLMVTVGFKLLDFLALDINHGTFQLKFQLQTKWRDADLTFKNVKKGIVNVLDLEDWKSMWVPNLLFLNTESILSSEELGSDFYSFVYLDNIHETEKDIQASVTNFFVMGKDVDIVKNSSYSLMFFCEFDPIHYPFDVQVCNINLTLYVADYKKVQLQAGPVEAETSMYEDFNVSNWKIMKDNSPALKGVKLSISFMLKRNLSQSLMSTFMPNIILMVVSILTNYFLGKDLFEAVISINATVLMTVASLFADNSGLLPATVTIK